MAEYSTLLLDQSAWDLVIDAAGNIAVAGPPYSLAQDVASAVRTFKGEVYYDTTLGIPYFDDSPASLLTQQISDEALTVPGTVTAATTVNSFSTDGTLNGTVAFTDESGEVTTLTL